MRYAIVLMLFVLALACKKEKDQDPIPAGPYTPAAVDSNYFIAGDIDAVYKWAGQLPYAGASYYDTVLAKIQLSAIENALQASTSFSWSISIYDDMDTITLPKAYNSVTSGKVVISYNVVGASIPYVNWGTDAVSSLTITATGGDTILGNFNTAVYTSTDTLVVTNGEFKVKVKRQ